MPISRLRPYMPELESSRMGVEIKSVRGESVQEGITSPFLVRVRQGEGTVLFIYFH